MTEPRQIWLPEDGDNPPPGEKRSMPVEAFVALNVKPFKAGNQVWVSIQIRGAKDGKGKIIAFELGNFFGMVEIALASNGLEMVPKGSIGGAIYDFAGYLSSRQKSFKVGATQDAAVMVKQIRDWADERGISMDEVNLEWNVKNATTQGSQSN